MLTKHKYCRFTFAAIQLFHGVERPLTDDEMRPLLHNNDRLVELIDTTALLEILTDNNVITEAMREHIKSKENVEKKNKTLLVVMLRRSGGDLKKLISCLRDQGQQHVASILSGGGEFHDTHCTNGQI